MSEPRTGQEAARWLSGRVDKLEQRVTEAPEIERLTGSVVEVLADLDADPEAIVRDGVDRLRRFAAQVGRAAAERVEADGFQLDALDRWAWGLVAEDPRRAREVLLAMADALRERMEALGTDGAERHGGAQATFADAVDRVGAAVRGASERWVTQGAGRRRRSILPWRRRAARRARPEDDPVWRAEVAQAMRRVRAELEGGLRASARAAVSLTLARTYGEVATHLGALAEAAERLGELAPSVVGRAERTLTELRAGEDGPAARTADASLLDDAALEPVLARLGVDAESFLQRQDPEELARATERDLEQRARDFAASKLGHLAAPTLAEALSGGSHGDKAAARRRLAEWLLRGQPLVAFDDAVAARFVGGAPAHHLMLVETSDPTVRTLVHEACAEAGLPAPRFEAVPVTEDEGPSLRVIQLVAGLPFFSQVDRLSSMIRTWRETMSGADGARVGEASLASVLRDLQKSEDLGDILPDELVKAAARRRELDPLEMDDDAGSPGDDAGGHVTPFPAAGSTKARG